MSIGQKANRSKGHSKGQKVPRSVKRSIGQKVIKELDIMLKFKQEIHKKGEVFAWKYKNSTILL